MFPPLANAPFRQPGKGENSQICCACNDYSQARAILAEKRGASSLGVSQVLNLYFYCDGILLHLSEGVASNAIEYSEVFLIIDSVEITPQGRLELQCIACAPSGSSYFQVSPPSP